MERQFPADYEAHVVERPPAGEVEFVFDDGSASSRSTVIVFIPDEGRAWEASFAAARPLAHRVVSGVFASPHPSKACVLERGTAFLVDVFKPGTGGLIDQGPVVGVHAAIQAGLLLLATPWTLTAVGRDGTLWTTARLAADGFRIDVVDDRWIKGFAGPEDEARPFAVEIASGKLNSGPAIS